MPYPVVFGWKPLPTKRTPSQWDRVKSEAIDSIPGVTTPEEVNHWVNSNVTYTQDVVDHWQLPSETMERREGDCEDIAILKRALLKASGYQDDQVFFVIVKDLITRQDHAVVVVDGLSLDSFSSVVLPLDEVRDYTPILALTGTSGWLFGRPA